MTTRTRKAIMDSCIKLLNERPVNKISVKDIVEDCGINRNTFYYHFCDLPSLIEAITQEEADQIIQKICDRYDFAGMSGDCGGIYVEASPRRNERL